MLRGGRELVRGQLEHEVVEVVLRIGGAAEPHQLVAQRPVLEQRAVVRRVRCLRCLQLGSGEQVREVQVCRPLLARSCPSRPERMALDVREPPWPSVAGKAAHVPICCGRDVVLAALLR